MATNADIPTSRLDSLKWSVALLLLAAGVAGFYWFSDQYLLVRVLGLLAVVVVAIAIAFQTEKGRETWAFVEETRTEVRKVVWPTRKETVQNTSVIVAVVVVAGLFLWLLDLLLAAIVRHLVGG